MCVLCVTHVLLFFFFFFSSRRRHTRFKCDWSSDVCSSDLPAALSKYAKMCGSALARGHAKAGDAAAISGYLGSGESFDEAIAAFACTYADQTERDHAAMVQAVKAGRLVAQLVSG